MRENERYAIIAQRWNTADILQASALHDIGMIVVPEEILLKPGKLTEEEFERMQRHVPVGLRMLERMETPSTARFFQLAKDVVAMHHERWDGSGYPKGLKGSETPLLGRLMALVDVYSALRRPRPYREAKSRDAALAEIFALQNVHFDPDLVEVCRSVADRLP
ncbi:MAG: HD domain-containing protein [Desulfovibrio sp.]|nr:HD domain-containing protein [Desulfovibrio sp.]